MTVRDVAAVLELTDQRVYQLIAEGSLPHTRAGRRIRIPRAAFDRWLEQQAEKALANVRDAAAEPGS